MKSLMIRVIHQMRNDKRSLALILFAPLLVISLVYFLLGDSKYVPTIGFTDEKFMNDLSFAFDSENVTTEFITFDNPDSAHIEQYLKDNKNIDAIFAIQPDNAVINIYMLESSTKSAKAIAAIQKGMFNASEISIQTHFVYGKADGSTFDNFGYVFLGLFSFFFVFIISGMALVRERSGGTLERMLMTPIKRWEVITGYTAGYGVFAVVQAILIVVYSIFVLKLDCAGNPVWVFVLMLLMAITAVSFGAMISVFSHSEFQVVQFIPIVLIPQVFFSGLIPLDTIPYGLGNICYITPVYYGCAAIKKVMIEGEGFIAILPFILALLAYTFILCVLNTIALKKYRKL
ncbi:MAG: ABC transporter permease [Oscillospiraceae bacterium]|nr:ABC transporter permease [Oscillospiraceae bacterium]